MSSPLQEITHDLDCNAKAWPDDVHTFAGEIEVQTRIGTAGFPPARTIHKPRFRKRRLAKGVRSRSFNVGYFLLTFLTLLSLFPSLFCQTPSLGLLLRQDDNWNLNLYRKSKETPLSPEGTAEPRPPCLSFNVNLTSSEASACPESFRNHLSGNVNL